MPFRIKLTLIALLLTFLGLLIVPLVIVAPPLAGTVPPRQLAGANSRFAEVDGLEVHYRLKGEGKPNVVLLHGFGGSTFSWRHALGPLAATGTTVAFDRPAFGLTERPMPGDWAKGENPYAPEAQLELTLGLMDALDMDSAVLIGSSSGGAVALQLALEYPERVDALVLVGPTLAGGGPPSWARPLLYTPQFARLGPLMMRQFAGESGEVLIRNAWADPEALGEEVIAGHQAWLGAQDWDRALWELTKASRRPDFLTEVGSAEMPILVVAGADDPVVPARQYEQLAQAIPGAELVRLESCGHLPPEECPDAFLAAVEEFLVGLPNPIVAEAVE